MSEQTLKFPCPSCGKTVELDSATYGDFTGDVTCPHCTGVLVVSTFHGTLCMVTLQSEQEEQTKEEKTRTRVTKIKRRWIWKRHKPPPS